jgi:hypothetical protein
MVQCISLVWQPFRAMQFLHLICIQFMVGRTPWSARVPLDPLFAAEITILHLVVGRRGRSAPRPLSTQ